MSALSLGAGVRGTLCGFPFAAAVWTEGGTVCLRGTLTIEDKGLRALLAFVDLDVDDTALVEVIDQLVGPIKLTLDVAQTPTGREFSVEQGPVTFRALSRGASSAFVLALSEQAPQQATSGPTGVLLEQARIVRDALGISLLVAYRTGSAITLDQLRRGSAPVAVPPALSQASWLFLGRFAFDGTSTAARAIHDLLGIESIDLVAGVDIAAGAASACLAIPKIDNDLLAAEGLYLAITLGPQPSFQFRGSFTFKFLSALTFTAAGSFAATGFTLSAAASAPDPLPIPLLPGFFFGDVGLLVGFTNGGLTFGLFATLFARKLKMFGAVLLSLKGQFPVPTLLSAALSRVTLPTLFENLTGHSLEGLAAFDVLALDGLPFTFPEPFDTALLAAGDKPAIVTFFNAHIASQAFSLDAADIELRPLPEGAGYGLVDRARMRHYAISGSGQLTLQAQIYYAVESAPFGPFTVSRGLFFAGSLALTDPSTPAKPFFSFEVLFSLREGEGLFAYARLSRITLGPLGITASKDPIASPIGLPPTDLVSRLVPDKPEGPVLYVAATRREITFYFDGRVELASLLALDARVIYAARKISIHTETLFLGIHTIVALDASYDSVFSAAFDLHLHLDTKALAAGLSAVTERVDAAIKALASTVAETHRSLDAARAHVAQLRGEIAALDVKIAACTKEIDDAGWWAKAFVAVAKGLEIAAYEIAKAGVYTAIGIANAGITLAEKAVSLFGDLGAEVLALVNTTVRAATSLFFIRSADITVSLGLKDPTFSIDLAFTVLGKEQRYEAKLSGLELVKDKIFPWLSEKLTALLQPQLDAVAQGKPAAPFFAAAAAAPRALEGAPRPAPDIQQAASQLDRAAALFAHVQASYRRELAEDLTDFDALRASFLGAIHLADNALHTAASAAPPPETANLYAALRDGGARSLSEEDRGGLDDALSAFERALLARPAIDSASAAASRARDLLARPPPPPPAAARATTKEAFTEPMGPPEPVESRMARLLDDLRDTVETVYPPDDTAAGYINLSREPLVTDSISQARSALTPEGASPEGAPVRAVRSRAPFPPDDYRPRLGR